uniref:E3 ubiquitin-protein ligase Topors n=1 Tax=Anser cygnoides TaxID=8845 RepID=A0A8B9E0P8_ANSCY
MDLEMSDSMATALDTRCPICLDSWVNPSYVVPCLHRFCFACIQRWAETKPECPLCKRRVSSIVHSVTADNSSLQFPLNINKLCFTGMLP